MMREFDCFESGLLIGILMGLIIMFACLRIGGFL